MIMVTAMLFVLRVMSCVCSDNSCSHYVSETTLRNESKNGARRYLGKTDVNGELSKNGEKLTLVHCVCSTLYDVEFSPSRLGVLKYSAPFLEPQTCFTTQELYISP